MKTLKIIIVLTLLSSVGQALDTKKLSESEKFPKAINLYDYKSTKSLKNVSAIKWHQLNSQFTKCAELAEKNSGIKSHGVWIAYTHLKCLKSIVSRKSSWKVNRIIKSFKKLESNKTTLLNSPFNGHRDTFLDVFLDVAELALDNSRSQFEPMVNRNHDLVDYMGENQRAEYYRIMGEFAWLRQKNDLAAANFIRSYRFKENSKVLSRLKSLKAEGPLKINKYTQSFTETDEENKLWGKFATAFKKGQTYKIAQYGVDFLNTFPGSKRVMKIRDDINTVYKRLLYRRGRKYESIKSDFENQLKKAQPEHILFWGNEAYERGYQASSFKLASRAAEKWEDTPYAAPALLIAARSAFYLVKRSKAESLLETLVEKYSGHEASFEANYLLGLLYYREKEYKKVIKLYDRFLQSSGSDKWELQVRYWLWRSLKKISSSRAKEIADTIFKTFPLTYYGLYVRMEEKGSIQNLLQKEPSATDVTYWWTQASKKRWDRIKNLITTGWLDEAETEIDFMPDPQTPSGFIVRAKLWRAADRENRAIKDFASAVDLDLNYISPNYLKETFPTHFEKNVLNAEKEFKISRNLIWAIMRQESAFRPRAISPSNAYGLMQLLSPTAKETARWLKVKKFKMPYDMFKPDMNVRFGTHFLSRMMGKYKNVAPLAIASYNVGPGNLDRWLSHRSDLKDWDKIGASPDDDIWMDELPWAETSFYVKAVMRNFLLYKIVHQDYDKLTAPTWKETYL